MLFGVLPATFKIYKDFIAFVDLLATSVKKVRGSLCLPPLHTDLQNYKNKNVFKFQLHSEALISTVFLFKARSTFCLNSFIYLFTHYIVV